MKLELKSWKAEDARKLAEVFNGSDRSLYELLDILLSLPQDKDREKNLYKGLTL